MLDSYEVRPGIDWTPDFIKAFIAHNDYDPTPWLPVLAGWTVASKELSDRFQHDYHKTGQRPDDREPLRPLPRTAQPARLAVCSPKAATAATPASIRSRRSAPRTSRWANSGTTARTGSPRRPPARRTSTASVSSTAESFTGWQNWQDGPAAYKRLLDIALCAGLNQVTFHTFAHNPPEAGLPGFAYHAGEHFNVNSTWWDQAGPMLEDMSRCCHLLQQGRFVADVCAYYGDEAPNLVPARRIAPTIKSQWSDDKCAHCGKPKPVNLDSLGQGYDYDYINEEVILTRMKVQDGRLVLPDGMSYRLMVLPDRKTISPAVLKRIGRTRGSRRHHRRPETGTLQQPARLSRLRSRGAGSGRADLGRLRWRAGANASLRQRQGGLEHPAAMKSSPAWASSADFIPENVGNEDQHIDYIHRATDDEDIYFVSNSCHDPRSGALPVPRRRGTRPSFWHAEDGTVTPCHAYEVQGRLHRISRSTSRPPRRCSSCLPKASSAIILSESIGPRIRRGGMGREPSGDRGGARMAAGSSSQGVAGRHLSVQNGRRPHGNDGRFQHVPADQALDGPWRVTFPKRTRRTGRNHDDSRSPTGPDIPIPACNTFPAPRPITTSSCFPKRPPADGLRSSSISDASRKSPSSA